MVVVKDTDGDNSGKENANGLKHVEHKGKLKQEVLKSHAYRHVGIHEIIDALEEIDQEIDADQCTCNYEQVFKKLFYKVSIE